MNLWFKQILPYLVLVIFHLNSFQVDHQATTPSGDQPADPTQALYRPPGAPFGPIYFTKYPSNPAYLEFNLENILIANSLARTRETKHIGCKGKWYKVPPLLFKDKYNYLPAYFVPMTLPLTLQPDHLIEPTTATETMYTQLFRLLYITLTELVDSMVPNSGPWSLIRKYHPSYGGHYPLAQLCSVPSQPMPLPMPGFLTPGAKHNTLVLTTGGTHFSVEEGVNWKTAGNCSGTSERNRDQHHRKQHITSMGRCQFRF
ncbi:hypothetical protein DSO57_1011846 [Entomophthora muscae]|uniref:Uncharacterized protein n=1 Tax=Entomophthora muscae TaxID=34485 RepID=A0ACC2RL19_9FUNG|nr:hypothetical protein DSO57_1011846 [Entomophthora muscae]